MLHNISFIFQKMALFLDFIIFCSSNTFSIKHVLKLSTYPGMLKFNPFSDDIIPYLEKSCQVLRDLKCGHKIEFGRAEFLKKFFASVHLSVELRYIYYIEECTAVK